MMKTIGLLLSISILLFACNASDDAGRVNDSNNSNNKVSKGGSTTRFTIVDEFLYVVEEQTLKTFDISNTASPELIDTVVLTDELETIFPYTFEGENVLLLGAKNGLHLFKIRADGTPNKGDNVVLTHARSCDPVIAQNGYAYVTLRSSVSDWGCNQGVNELQVMDISSIELPTRVKAIKMDGPKGLSFSQDGNALLVCDKNALKVFSLIDPENPKLEQEYLTAKCDDILQYGEHYIVTGQDLLEIYTFDQMTYKLSFEIDLLDD